MQENSSFDEINSSQPGQKLSVETNVNMDTGKRVASIDGNLMDGNGQVQTDFNGDPIKAEQSDIDLLNNKKSDAIDLVCGKTSLTDGNGNTL